MIAKIQICLLLLLPLSLGAVGPITASAESDLVWLAKPARHFTEASPMGNGRLGAMVFGRTDEEIVVLNESGMWSGSPQDADRPDAAAALPEIRRLIFAGKNAAAEELMNSKFTCAGKGSGLGRSANLPYGCYQTLGKLHLKFLPNESDAPVENYRRELDLQDAVVRISYSQGGVDYLREAFVSFPDQVLVYRLHSSKAGALSFDVSLDRPERSTTTSDGENELVMKGQLNDGRNGVEGVRFSARTRVLHEGGSVSAHDNLLQVRGATSVVLLVGAATDMQRLTRRAVEDPDVSAKSAVLQAATKSFAELRKQHALDFRQYYDRVSLRLTDSEEQTSSEKPIDERLRALWEGEPDNGLTALYFNFGRYLFISASRPDGRPANLQGIWAAKIQTPWNGDWHLNVNVQMNYWPAEVCNLSDLHEPLFRLIESLVEPGSQTARKYYDAGGWVAHVLANPWGYTSPGESAGWGTTSTCSAWLCQHLWDHYLFTQDQEFLRRAYPVMKGAAEFYLEVLVEHPKQGWLVTAPSTSPENSFFTSDGAKAHVCLGSTMEMQLLRSLFGACQQAATILRVDEQFRDRLAQTTKRLAPTRVASDGRIMEWDEEYTETDPTHRHVPHLWGLYPGHEIYPSSTPQLAEAARKTLEKRGDSGTGWGLANKMAMWSRLNDGHRAHHLLCRQLRPIVHGQAQKQWSGGTYPNLFSAHPPFQIDGNLGATAAIAEMLVQSSPPNFEAGGLVEIKLLPALPEVWSEGEVTGLCARGGFEVKATWENGQLTAAEILSHNTLPSRITYGSHGIELKLKRGETAVLDGHLKLLSIQEKP